MSTRLDLPLRRLRWILGIAVPAGLLVVCAGGTASAHVTAHLDQPVRGASDVAVAFRVPNETDDAPTTRLEVDLPLAHPMLGVLVPAHPGWRVTARTSRLAQPVGSDDGDLTEAVSQVVWTADSAADALQPGQSADFVLTAGQLPDAGSLTFRAVQTYATGQVVRWDESGTDAENPAPTVILTSPVVAGSHFDPTARVLGGAGVAAALGSMGLLVTLGGRRLSRVG